MIAHHTIERAGSRLHYWLTGPEAAPLVALIHGMQLDHTMWAEQEAALAGRFRVLTLDLRGHGRSQPGGERLSIPMLVDDLIAFLAHAGRQRAALVGHSLGGIVAQELAFRYPPRVTALAVFGCSCVTLPAPPAMGLAIRAAGPLMRLAGLAPYWPLARLNIRQMSARPDVSARLPELAAAVSHSTFLAALRALAASRHPEPGYAIRQPLLLLRGERDRFGGPGRMAAWAARDRHAAVVTIPGARHNANQDNPAAFNAALLPFLEQALGLSSGGAPSAALGEGDGG